MADGMIFEEFVLTNPLPQRAKVIDGYEYPYRQDFSFSNGDVIEVRRIQCPFVALRYIDSETGSEVRVTLPTDNPTRFRFPPPQTARSRVFSTVKQLVDAWPLVVTARCDHNHPDPAFIAGDRLRLIRLNRSRADGGKTPVLEMKNFATLELVQLPYNYASTFAEATPIDRRLYTLGELAEIARVPRQLVLRHEDQNSPDAWIPGLPLDFSGYVTLDKPHYLVEVQAITEKDLDNVDTNRFLVSIDSDITLAAREPDYVICWSDRECSLDKLADKSTGVFPRIVSILSWKEETTILQNHFVRPGDRLVLYSLETVRKLAVTVGPRRFLVPLEHPDEFCLLRHTTTAPRRLLHLVSTSTRFPLTLERSERGHYVNVGDETLPRAALKAEMIVEEKSVVAAKLDREGRRLHPSFRLPLRTRIELHFHARWKKSADPPNVSRWDCMAEEVTKSVYHTVTGKNWSGMNVRMTVDFTAVPTHDVPGMAHGRPRNASASDEYDTSQSLERDKPPPLLARTRSQTLPHEPVIVTHRRVPPPPPPPPTRIASLCRIRSADRMLLLLMLLMMTKMKILTTAANMSNFIAMTYHLWLRQSR